MLSFGAIQYFDEPLVERPDVAIAAIEWARDGNENERVVFRGMFSGTDRWSRRVRVTDRSLAQLKTDIAGNVFDDVLALRGESKRETFTISLNCGKKTNSHFLPFDFTAVADRVRPLDLACLEQRAHTVWRSLNATYGFTVVGESSAEVQSELSAIPINLPGKSHDAAREKQLLSRQLQRKIVGEKVRDATWGTYLGKKLVERLGGVQSVVRNAPAGFSEVLDGGSVYLRLLATADQIDHEKSASIAERLTEFLQPILLSSA